MSKSGYLQRKNDVQNAIMRAAERLTEQFMEDTMVMTLHRFGWGYDRICRMLDDWTAIRKEYTIALQPSNPEADVAQEHIDSEIRAVCKGKTEIIPFEQRYPELKKITYEGRKR